MKNYFVGLDVGTNSVGWAVTDEAYNLIKFHGEPLWGSTVFEEGKTSAEKRGFRTARRRLDRRQQRVYLTQEIFAEEIAKVDPNFYIRIKESALFREDTSLHAKYSLFEEPAFDDPAYHAMYPTIHHLLCDLMESKEAKDVRLVYLAVAWLMAHRGHFLSEIDKTKLDDLLSLDAIYQTFQRCIDENYSTNAVFLRMDAETLGKIMRENISVTRKERKFQEFFNDGKKFKDAPEDTVSAAGIIKLLCGGTIGLNKLFFTEAYKEFGSISLTKSEEEFATLLAELPEEEALLRSLRGLYDWALLANVLGDSKNTISKAKVAIYEQHRADLQFLKGFVKKYLPKAYHRIFRSEEVEGNYVAYIGRSQKKSCIRETFNEFLKKELKNVSAEKVSEDDLAQYENMMMRIEAGAFMPKQVDGDNRVIPYQLYWHELHLILENAGNYLPFLKKKDADGFSNQEKLEATFEFRVPYFVGPLRTDNSKYAWMQRKASGKIYPWNFADKVDLDASEERFIQRMTNTCTYLPGQEVLPKNSLLYGKFMVLNEINNIKVNEVSIPVEVKQEIFKEFENRKKVTVNRIREILKSNGCLKDTDSLSGLDESVKSGLSSYAIFKDLLREGVLSEEQVEDIIAHRTYTEDTMRMRKWLREKYPHLNESDRRYIEKQKLKDFGRLSKELLTGFLGINKETGEETTVLDALWNTNDNLMQILQDESKYTFRERLEEERQNYYATHKMSMDTVLDEMYISNSVRRPIYRTLAIMKDIQKATKAVPKRIFVEMARGGGEKGNRKASRKSQLTEFYKNLSSDETRTLSHELDGFTDQELQSEKLYLYFMQLGRCVYSGKPIDINQLKSGIYDVDHIYPQSKKKDDSLDNKVLVLSTINGDLKKDKYPIPPEACNKQAMIPFWKHLKNADMMTEEKYNRLVRSTPFSEAEKREFINRQLVETRQSTKALTAIFKQLYPETEIVYVKSGIVSDFRKEFDLLKSRAVNDLHHGKDAYLNIVCGNVYHCRFTKNFNIDSEYSLKLKTLFSHDVHEGKNLVWDGEKDLGRIKRIMQKNNLHYTRFAFERKTGLFHDNPEKKGSGAVPRKANLPIEKYGGYNDTRVGFFVLVKYGIKKKNKMTTDVMIMPVDIHCAEQAMCNEETLRTYARSVIARITQKEESEIEILGLPIGMKKILINQLLLAGKVKSTSAGKSNLPAENVKLTLAGKSNKGSYVSLGLATPLILSGEAYLYVKKLERFAEKKKAGKLSTVDEKYDGICREKNLELYETLTEKINNKQYVKLFAKAPELMKSGKEMFERASVEEQVVFLLSAIAVFEGGRTTGCDLRLVGGGQQSATIRMPSNLSDWKKKYEDVRITDVSASGIYTSQTGNLLEML